MKELKMAMVMLFGIVTCVALFTDKLDGVQFVSMGTLIIGAE